MTGYNAYRGNQINASTPLELTLLTYEALASALHQAKLAHQANDFDTTAEQSHRALRAIAEMLNSLDYEQGGQLAVNLGSLYVYMTKRILAAQTDDTQKILTEVEEICNNLRSGWQELKKQQENAWQEPLEMAA